MTDTITKAALRQGEECANIDAEITRRKALRSQPAPFPAGASMFKVGDRAEVFDITRGKCGAWLPGSVTVVGSHRVVVELDEGDSRAIRHGDAALRSQPAPVPTTESEFKVGERVEGRCFRGHVVIGAIEPGDGLDGLLADCIHTGKRGILVNQGDDGPCYVVAPASLRRRLPASTHSATVQPGPCNCRVRTDPCAGAHDRDCPLVAARIAADKPNATEAPVAKPCSHCDNPNCHSHKFQIDPYAEHRAAVARHDPAVEETARLRRVHQATVREDTLRDLDRPLTPPRYPNRYVCVGVMGDGAPVKQREVKGAPSTWPSVDSGPGWED